MSIAASWLIAVVIILRFVLKKVPKWLMPALWGVAGLRLLLPVTLTSVISLIPSARPLPKEMLHESTFQIYSGVPVIDEPVNRYIGNREAGKVSEAVAGQNHFMTILGIAWLIGVGVMLIYALFSYLRMKKNVTVSVPCEGNVRVCDRISFPFILGVIRPKIYLPSGLNKEDEQYVLAHERAHLKRLDHIWKPLGYLLLCVYWFNPFVWAAYVFLCKDIELACDEKVIGEFDLQKKKAYATALLDCSIGRRMVMACPLAFGEVGVKERVKSVLKYKKPAYGFVLAAVFIFGIIGACFLTNPVQKVKMPKNPIIFTAKDTEGEEETLYWEKEGLKYQMFMALKPDMVGDCIGYDEYDGEKISNICKVKGMSEKEWICDTVQDKVTDDVKGFVWKEVKVTEIPEGWESLDFVKMDSSESKMETARQEGNQDVSGTVEERTEKEHSQEIENSDEAGMTHDEVMAHVEVMDRVCVEYEYKPVPWSNTIEFKEKADILINMAEDSTGRYKVYGIISKEYGCFGMILNDTIDGTDVNANTVFERWYYTGVSESEPKLTWKGDKLYFTYPVPDADGFKERTVGILCGFNTGHMEFED